MKVGWLTLARLLKRNEQHFEKNINFLGKPISRGKTGISASRVPFITDFLNILPTH